METKQLARESAIRRTIQSQERLLKDQENARKILKEHKKNTTRVTVEKNWKVPASEFALQSIERGSALAMAWWKMQLS